MSNSDQTDYDKKYQEDLEKAQALSLETHALEKFRQNKQRADFQNTSTLVVKQGVKSQISSTRLNKLSNYENQSSKNTPPKATLRPRPGCIESSSNFPNVPKLPPPQYMRRDSASSNSSEISNVNDLISFPSPPLNKHMQQCVSSNVNSRNSSRAAVNVDSISTSAGELYPHFFQHSFVSHISPSSNSSQSIGSSTSKDLSGAYQNFSNQYTKNSKDNVSLHNVNFLENKSSGNLIDLTTSDGDSSNRDKNVRVSLLEAFDPLVINSTDETDYEDRIYEPYDPFDFLYSTYSTISNDSNSGSKPEPIYSTINKSNYSPPTAPPLPPRNTPLNKGSLRKGNTKASIRLYENIKPIRRTTLIDEDLIAFHNNVKNIRDKFDYTDTNSNTGIVISPMMENNYAVDTSIKLIIHCSSINLSQPMTFTCDVNSSVEHVLMHVACEAENDSIEDFLLKVYSLAEYLETNSCLADYEYVHNCIKLEKDVELTMLRKDGVARNLLRTCSIKLDGPPPIFICLLRSTTGTKSRLKLEMDEQYKSLMAQFEEEKKCIMDEKEKRISELEMTLKTMDEDKEKSKLLLEEEFHKKKEDVGKSFVTKILEKEMVIGKLRNENGILNKTHILIRKENDELKNRVQLLQEDLRKKEEKLQYSQEEVEIMKRQLNERECVIGKKDRGMVKVTKQNDLLKKELHFRDTTAQALLEKIHPKDAALKLTENLLEEKTKESEELSMLTTKAGLEIEQLKKKTLMNEKEIRKQKHQFAQIKVLLRKIYLEIHIAMTNVYQPQLLKETVIKMSEKFIHSNKYEVQEDYKTYQEILVRQHRMEKTVSSIQNKFKMQSKKFKVVEQPHKIAYKLLTEFNHLTLELSENRKKVKYLQTLLGLSLRKK